MSSFKACCCRHIRCLLLGICHVRSASTWLAAIDPRCRGVRSFVVLIRHRPPAQQKNLTAHSLCRLTPKFPLPPRQRWLLPFSASATPANNRNEAMHVHWPRCRMAARCLARRHHTHTRGRCRDWIALSDASAIPRRSARKRVLLLAGALDHHQIRRGQRAHERMPPSLPRPSCFLTAAIG